MRKYTLAAPVARSTVDLRRFRGVIEAAVHEIVPSATVRVERDCYYVEPTPCRRDAVRIGRLICKSDLRHNCVKIPKLFSSIEIDRNTKEVQDDNSKQKQTGKHSRDY